MLVASIVAVSVVSANAHPTFEQWAAEWGINSAEDSMSQSMK